MHGETAKFIGVLDFLKMTGFHKKACINKQRTL